MILSSTKVALISQTVGRINLIIGEGIVILLCGPPGVGKTLTAEGGEAPSFSAPDAADTSSGGQVSRSSVHLERRRPGHRAEERRKVAE